MWNRLNMKSSTDSADFAATLIDVREGIERRNVWLNFALHDTFNKYERTTLGPLWNSLTLVVIILMLGAVWSVIFGQKFSEFLPRISVGYMVWWFINSIVGGATGLFSGQHLAMLQNTATPKFCMVMRHVASCFFLFLHNIIPVILIVLIAGVPISPVQILFIPGIGLILLAGVPATIILGILCARFRDMQVLVNTIMGVGIMISPVMWDLELLGDKAIYAYLNPFTSFLQITKLPALGQMPTALDFAMSTAMVVVLWVVALALYHRVREKIVLWV